ncbi:hypothetical protein [Sorangium sp. So ce124]|uniref:hypothetical protein n=1 Tax=Sorangium sp. So ce124 TaxID=3133280 RepID=UPI003F61B588
METSFAPYKIQTKQIKHPRAWDGKDLTKDEVAFDLGSRHLEAFDRVIQEVRRRSVTLESASNEDFQLEDIQDDVQLIADRILNGRGVVIVRGWPMDRYTEAENALLYWALGKQWGQPIVQSWKGDRLTELQREALEYFHTVGDELKFTFMLEAGEALFVNNYAILHDRAPFEDWPEQERRRFLLRMWLRTSQEKQPVHSSVRRFYDTMAGNFSPSPAKVI